MSVHDQVILFLESLKGADLTGDPVLHPDDTARRIVVEVFSKGNCGNLAVMLAIAFNGTIIELEHHMLCEIKGRYFDIDGDVTEKWRGTIVKGDYQPLSINDVVRHGQMYNNYSYDTHGPIL